VVAPAVVQSSQLAVDEINAAGGILGRKVELEIADDASGAVGAQKAFDTLVYEKKVDAIISMETSAARNAGLPIVARGRVPFIYTSFYEGHSCSPWMYVNGWVPEQQVAPIVDYMMKTQKAKSFFLVGSDYAFGRGMLGFTRKYIEQHGGKVVGEEYLPIDGTEWTPILSKIRDAKPDALISATAGGAPNVSLAKQLKGAGLNVPYGNLAIDEGTAKTMGDVANGMYMSASYLTSIDNKQNKHFVQALDSQFGGKVKTPNELSEPQYEAFYLYKEAVEKAG
jgi:ABC-type branched-subunit amino acid transport system substrate-binding protein